MLMSNSQCRQPGRLCGEDKLAQLHSDRSSTKRQQRRDTLYYQIAFRRHGGRLRCWPVVSEGDVNGCGAVRRRTLRTVSQESGAEFRESDTTAPIGTPDRSQHFINHRTMSALRG